MAAWALLRAERLRGAGRKPRGVCGARSPRGVRRGGWPGGGVWVMGGGWTGRINNMGKLMNKNIDLDYDLDDLVRIMKAETWSRRWILTLDNNVAIWD